MAIETLYPAIRPSLNLDFANAKALDPRISFSRASAATYYDGKTVAKAEENLLLNSAILATQSVATRAEPYTLSFIGTGTVTLSGSSSAGPLVGTGATNRVSLTFTPTAGTLTLTVSGAVEQVQLEARSSATAYTPTTTQPITNYIPVLQTAPAGVPRFDHNPVTGESLGLLVEEQRTNLLAYSEQFDNAAWVKSASSVVSNVVTAPDGTSTADKIIATATSGSHFVRSANTISEGVSATHSVYIKAAGVTTASFSAAGGVANKAEFDLATCSVISSSGGVATIVDVGNGWRRCGFTCTTSGYSNVPYWYAGGYSGFTGDGYSGIYIWGAQLEVGSFPTSYIKTEASQVTRAADSASMVGANFSSWYRQDEGTIFAEFQQYLGVPSSSQRVLQIGYPSQADGYLLFREADRFNAGTYFAGAYQASTSITEAGTEFKNNKVSYSYKVNSFTGAGNGKVYPEDTSGLLPTPVALYIGTNSATTNSLNGYIRRISFYPKALPNNIQALTA